MPDLETFGDDSAMYKLWNTLKTDIRLHDCLMIKSISIKQLNFKLPLYNVCIFQNLIGI